MAGTKISGQRILRLERIAKDHGIEDFSVRNTRYGIVACIKGCTFKVKGYDHFVNKCKELKDYVEPKPIDLTDRLIRIEEATLARYRAQDENRKE